MKKIFLVLVAAAVFISALGLHVDRAKADGYITYEGAEFIIGTGIVFTFDGKGFSNKELRGSTIWVGSDFYDLYCWARKDAGQIVCVLRGGLTEFAGQMGTIYLGGQVFWVLIPHKYGPPGEGEVPLSCPDGLVPGADVFVEFGEGTGTFFVPGETAEEVENNAQSWFGQFSYEIVSDLYCGEEPS
jgi:hypothetical protein